MRILMIEDDKELAEITKLRLEKDNFTVDVCLDGAEGLYYMQENMYDLVIWTACFLLWTAPRF